MERAGIRMHISSQSQSLPDSGLIVIDLHTVRLLMVTSRDRIKILMLFQLLYASFNA